MVNAPDNLDDLRRDLGRALSLITERAPGYAKAREYYDGTRAEIGGSRVADAIIAQSKATPISFAHVPVDVVVEKVELVGLTAAETAAAAALEAWADANDVDDEADDWILKAGYFGDYYVVSDPKAQDDDGGVAVEDVDTVGMSPLSAVVVYDAKTQRTALFGAHTWETGSKTKPETRAVLYYDDASVKLVTASGKSADAADYVLDVPDDGDDEDAWIRHDGGRMLISHLPIGGKPYGVPLHKRAWAFQDAIAKVSANNLVNVDAQGLPSRWALLDPAAEIDDEIDDDFGTDGPSTISGDGQRAATKDRRARTVPGAINMLRGVKSTGTYDAGDSNSFLSNLDWYLRGMAVACGVPLFELDPKGVQPSGESRRRAESRANRKAVKVTRSAGAFLRDVADTVLGLVGVTGTVTASFAPAETQTDKEGLELVSAKVKAGVPLRQALVEAGYTPEQVEEWYPKSSPVAYSPEVVELLARGLAALGNAKTLGVIDDATIAKMLPELIEITAATEGVITALPALPAAVNDESRD
jgi:hypothetical protein